MHISNEIVQEIPLNSTIKSGRISSAHHLGTKVDKERKFWYLPSYVTSEEVILPIIEYKCTYRIVNSQYKNQSHLIGKHQ